MSTEEDALTVARFAWTPMGVFSYLRLPELQLYAIESPWRQNIPWLSCIPSGEYALAPCRFNRGGYPTYEVLGVPGRSQIKIHVGNTSEDLRGCIAPGMNLGSLAVESRGLVWAVVESRLAFSILIPSLDRLGIRKIVFKSDTPEAGGAKL
jgi:uncharacterized protein DUF5675